MASKRPRGETGQFQLGFRSDIEEPEEEVVFIRVTEFDEPFFEEDDDESDDSEVEFVEEISLKTLRLLIHF